METNNNNANIKEAVYSALLEHVDLEMRSISSILTALSMVDEAINPTILKSAIFKVSLMLESVTEDIARRRDQLDIKGLI